MFCAHITDSGLIKNTGFFIHEMEAYKKLLFDIKGLLYKEVLTPYEAMNSTLSHPIQQLRNAL